MGESKRRKQRDRNYGKSPTTILGTTAYFSKVETLPFSSSVEFVCLEQLLIKKKTSNDQKADIALRLMERMIDESVMIPFTLETDLTLPALRFAKEQGFLVLRLAITLQV